MDNEEESQNLNELAGTELDANVVESGTRMLRSLTKFKTDKDFRIKIIRTLLLFWTFFGLGWMTGQIGPSFPDLQLVVQETLDTASWLFTIYSFGYMTGSLGGGLLFDHFSKPLVIALATLILAVTTVSLPWCRWFTLMLVVRFVSGLGAGALDTGANAYVMSFWGEKAGPYMQGLHFCFSMGGIVSPLATEPFLAERSCHYLNLTESKVNQSDANLTLTEYVSNNATGNKCQTTEFAETYIYLAYIISSVVIITSSIPFFVIYVREILKTFQTPTQEVTSEQPDEKEVAEQRIQIIMSKRARILILFLICLFMMVYCAVEDTFSSFLATFCIRYFGWTKATSSYATSVFWMAFAVGRFLAIFIVKMFKPVNLLLSYSSFLILAFVGVLIACLTSITIILWVSICIAGFSMSLIFPSVYSWTEESILQVTGKISSFFVIAGSIGLIINPVVLGYLMEKMTPLWFVYLLLGKSCFSLILLFAVLTLVNFFKQKEDSKTVDADDGTEMVPLQKMQQ
ncbi:sodium-dependent glucose transporter 1A-like isoform X2 [Ruditapes philippinarum]|uniref:sodium-dependent glucose transporter 1A-like isoform X2 n=1 Tax=Ruditapes philippinarum TaxID=129788 RepID=UPI00295BCEBB|nr:sodium-dependent glucose transporter 1A-like isoform X2 [Ruditapes philippinarum]